MKLGYCLLLILALFVVSFAQTREEFRPLDKGFKAARAVEKDGSPAMLLLFPEEYLTSEEKFEEGTIVVLPILFGCKAFVDCKPILGQALDENGHKVRTVELLGTNEDPRVLKLSISRIVDSQGNLLGILVFKSPDKGV